MIISRKAQKTIFLIILGFSCAKVMALPWDTEPKTNIPFRHEKTSQATERNVEKFITYLVATTKNRTLLSETNVNSYFDQNVEYSLNGIAVAHTARELAERFQRVSAHLTQYNILSPKITIIANHMAVITYQLTETRTNGEVYHNSVSAQLTYTNGKISKWSSIIEHLS